MCRAIGKIFFVFTAILLFLPTADGHIIDCLPRGLQEMMGNSSLIVVGRLTSYQRAAHSVKEPFENDIIFGTKSNHDAGRYRFFVVSKVKGACGSTLTLDLPLTASRKYLNIKLSLNPGELFLLCLKKNSKGSLTPADAGNPMIPLRSSDYPHPLAQPFGQKIDSAVTGLLIDSLPSPEMRPLIAYYLAPLDDPRILSAMLPYLKDRNPYVKDAVLACMAKNQQVTAIPLIIRFNHQGNIFGTQSLYALEKYRTKQAIPMLSRAVYDSSWQIREGAVRTLAKIEDVSSIPSLVLALNDPNSDVVYQAYFGLHTLIPSLGPVKTFVDFEKNRKAETALLLTWWKDELSGKHPKPKKPETRAVAVGYSSSSSKSSNSFSSPVAK